MGDTTNNRSGLIFRTAKFFNNENLSDLKFDVRGQPSNTSFYAHKLILAMASEKFASLLNNKDPSSKAIEVIQITNFSPEIVHLTLRYVYTDELNLTSVNEAMEVFRLASLLKINEVIEKCKKYIGLDRITEDNVFFLYDLALKENIKGVLADCRDLICKKTSEVLSSKQFCEATLEVLKDISNQDSLSIQREMDLIDAVLRWCRRDCVRRGRPTESVCIRDSIGPLLPYLRFLTFTIDEFCDFVDQNGILTSQESVLLTRKIIDPESNCEVPIGFCSNFRPRRNINDMILSPDVVRGTPLRTNANVPEPRKTLKVIRSPVTNEPPRPLRRPKEIIASGSPDLERQPASPIYSFPQNGTRAESLPPKSPFTFPPETKKSPMLKTVPSTAAMNGMREESLPHTSPFTFPSEAKKSPMLKTVPSTAAMNGTREESLPHTSLFTFPSETKKSPMQRMVPPTRRVFDFPLQEIQKDVFSVSKRDLICSAEISVSRGRMVIFGVELKITSLPQNPEENIRVGLSIFGDCPDHDSNSLVRLSNNAIALAFSEPISLSSNCSAKIEITIEDLKLNRCSVCKQDTFELNGGLNLATVINLSSNQNNEGDGFFFLISRILYC